MHEVAHEGTVVDLGPHRGMTEERLDLGAKDERLGRQRVVQRFLAQPVPGHDQSLPSAVPQGQRRHRIDLRDEFVSPVFIEVYQHLSVRASLKAMSSRDQMLSYWEVVVDLAV